LLNGLPDTWIRGTESESTWSPYDVVGHLIHGERTDWIPRARHILEGKTEPFERFDRTAQFTESKGSDLVELLATFAELRRRNLAALVAMKLTKADFERKGLHPELGEVTLGQLLATWVVHDLDHIAQTVPRWPSDMAKPRDRAASIYQSCGTAYKWPAMLAWYRLRKFPSDNWAGGFNLSHRRLNG
jgi:hypothetical protein